jgi:hypothetical protein
MSVTSRPSKITVDAVVAHEVLPTDTDRPTAMCPQQRRRGTSGGS